MKVTQLIMKEILCRKLNFGLAVLCVACAVGCFVAELTLLHLYDLRTEEVVARKQRETEQAMKAMEDEIRRITKNMGFNVQILPKEQNLSDFYAQDFASRYMPEAYVEKLANSGIMTVRHLLPILQQKVEWPELKRKIILVGTRSEVPLAHRIAKKPILDPVRPGTMVVGYELHRSEGMKPGDTVKFMGRTFRVVQCHAERGSKDDITVWINLREAQDLLHKEGKINGILALSCQCEGARLARIRAEITKILPDTQVIEFATKAVARAEARAQAQQTRVRMLEAEKAHRRKVRGQLETWGAVLSSVVAVGALVWIALLSFGNVRERRSEIGILRALGLSGSSVLALFLGRAVLVGICGAVLGVLGGVGVGAVWGSLSPEMSTRGAVLTLPVVVGALVAAPLLAVMAAWLPALSAAQQDPAEVLREE